MPWTLLSSYLYCAADLFLILAEEEGIYCYPLIIIL